MVIFGRKTIQLQFVFHLYFNCTARLLYYSSTSTICILILRSFINIYHLLEFYMCLFPFRRIIIRSVIQFTPECSSPPLIVAFHFQFVGDTQILVGVWRRQRLPCFLGNHSIRISKIYYLLEYEAITTMDRIVSSFHSLNYEMRGHLHWSNSHFMLFPSRNCAIFA